MKILQFKSKVILGEKLAQKLYQAIIKNPHLVIGLATGSTPLPFYRSFIQLVEVKPIDLSGVTTFNLDEYWMISPDNSQSYHHFMWKNLFTPLRLQVKQVNIPDGANKDYQKSAKDYEDKIKRAGRIDWQLLGIGENGHIGFNEPGSSFESTTRRVKLTESTIKANSRFFKQSSDVPKFAITMGLKTIFDAKEIFLVATGKEKSDIVARLIKKQPSEKVPASVLKNHPKFELWVDKECN